METVNFLQYAAQLDAAFDCVLVSAGNYSEEKQKTFGRAWFKEFHRIHDEPHCRKVEVFLDGRVYWWECDQFFTIHIHKNNLNQ